VHIFLRIDDPNVEEVNQGKRGGPGLEWVFQPGAEHAYHSFHFGSLPNTDDRHYVNWAAPTKHYRLTYDTVFKDAVTTPQGYAAHAFIPWIAVHDKMPSKNNVWGIGVQIWDGANTKTNSGTVHELSRLISLDFDFTPAQRIAIERETALQAFNSYNHIRQDAGGVIQNWNDAVLGDPDFYAAELAGFIAELDEAGKRLNAPAPDSEIHAIYEKYVPVWQEIKYILDEKRGEYLRKKLIQ